MYATRDGYSVLCLAAGPPSAHADTYLYAAVLTMTLEPVQPGKVILNDFFEGDATPSYAFIH